MLIFSLLIMFDSGCLVTVYLICYVVLCKVNTHSCLCVCICSCSCCLVVGYIIADVVVEVVGDVIDVVVGAVLDFVDYVVVYVLVILNFFLQFCFCSCCGVMYLVIDVLFLSRYVDCSLGNYFFLTILFMSLLWRCVSSYLCTFLKVDT